MGRGRGRGGGRGGRGGRGGGRGRGRGSSRGRGSHGPGRSSRGGSNKRPFHHKDDDDEHNQEPENKQPKVDLYQQALDAGASSSSDESEEEVKPYTQLLSLFKTGSKLDKAVSSDEESEEEKETLNEPMSNDEGQEDSGEMEDQEEEEEEEEATNEDQDMEEDEEENHIKIEEEEEIEDDSNTDTFHLHFEGEMSEEVLAVMASPKPYETRELHWKSLGRLVVSLPIKSEHPVDKSKPMLGETVQQHVIPGSLPLLKTGVSFKDLGVRAQLCANLDKRPLADAENMVNQMPEDVFSSLQHELFSLAHEYRDICFPEVDHTRWDEIRTVYCLHALNHVLKSRDKVLLHNTNLSKKAENDKNGGTTGMATEEVEYRDQGLVRPRVLIITPLRNSAVKIVEKLASLLLPKKGVILNKQRFYQEFGEEGESEEGAKKDDEPNEAKKSHKPEDYEAIFTGNKDDSFRLGIAVAKRTLRLYSGFYMSDILIASPLGLRTLLADDFDFLCSVEVLVMDQTDILYMQNWDHVIQVFQHLHLQPREQHGTDLGRVRLWALNGHSAHYRQNLIFSSIVLPEAAALFSRRGTNFAGKVRIENAVSAESAAVCRVVVQLPQAFHRFQTASAAQAAEDRFQFFTKKILPQYRGDALMSNTLIFVPSYYDYVRLRNYFHKEEVNFGQACEYTPEGKLAQVRNRFFLGKKRLLLYTERLHFYRRFSIKGIHHIVFYQLPSYPHFYAELSNLLQDSFQSKKYRGDSSQTCTVVYSTFDAPRLAAVVGSKRAAEMLTSDRPVHLFVSGGTG